MSPLIEALTMGLLATVAPSPHNLGLGFLSLEKVSAAKIFGFCIGALAIDALIIAFSLKLGTNTDSLHALAVPLKVAGSIFYLYLAYKLLFKSPQSSADSGNTHIRGGFFSGAIMQCCNPNPFLFWFLVGGPRAVHLQGQSGLLSAAIYVFTFLVVTYGGKGIVAYGLRNLPNQKPKLFTHAHYAFSAMLIFLAIKNIR